MVIVLIFIFTSIFQFIFYKKNHKKRNKINDFLITIIVILIYIFIYPILVYMSYQKENYINFSFFSQIMIIGSIGTIFALITYAFWCFEKKRNE